MTFYCDNQRHLICEPYSINNLHIMATALNIKRCWFHNNKYPHYDIPIKRMQEIQMQCTIISGKELLEKIKNYQKLIE